jgi:uncharacterized membrane protein
MILGSTLLVLHLLGAVLWVGGIGFVILVMRPSVAVIDAPARLVLHAEMFRRFFRLVWHLMPIVLLTGYAMVFAVYGGFQNVAWPVHVMHLTGLLMTALFLWIFFGPFAALKRAKAAGDAAMGAAAMAKLRPLAWTNLGLGIVTVIFAALGA